jgi:hypothetical protein
MSNSENVSNKSCGAVAVKQHPRLALAKKIDENNNPDECVFNTAREFHTRRLTQSGPARIQTRRNTPHRPAAPTATKPFDQ